MSRLFVAGLLSVGMIGFGASALAKPPVERTVQGHERTPIERDLHLPEQPVATEARSAAPGVRKNSDTDPIQELAAEVRAFLAACTTVKLGTVPMTSAVIY
jgi:hypothetical protein